MKFRSLTLSATALALGLVFSPVAYGAGDPVVGIVNGVEIKRSELEAVQKKLPQQYQTAPFEAIFSDLLNSEINSRLTAQDAISQGLDKDAELLEQLESIRQQLLQRSALQKVLDAGITEEVMQAKYNALIEPMKGQQEVNASHILLKTEEEAKVVIAELEKGADFAVLAKDKSTGPSAAQGGSLGFFAKGQMVPEFQDAAFAMDKGAYTKAAVKTQFGWHVIKVDDKRDVVPPTIEESAEQIRGELSRELAGKYIDGLRSKAKIEIFNIDGTPKK